MKQRFFVYTAAVIFICGIVILNGAEDKKFYTIDAKKCDACGTCAEECPEGAISAAKVDGKDVYVIDPEKCTACGVCAEVCPQESISPASSGDSSEIKGEKKKEGEEAIPKKEAKKKEPAEKEKKKVTKYTVK